MVTDICASKIAFNYSDKDNIVLLECIWKTKQKLKIEIRLWFVLVQKYRLVIRDWKALFWSYQKRPKQYGDKLDDPSSKSYFT